MHYFLKCN